MTRVPCSGGDTVTCASVVDSAFTRDVAPDGQRAKSFSRCNSLSLVDCPDCGCDRCFTLMEETVPDAWVYSSWLYECVLCGAVVTGEDYHCERIEWLPAGTPRWRKQ